MEKTIVLIKPDGVKRKLIGEIIQRFERRNFHIIGLKIMHWNKITAEKFYSIHSDKSFFPSLIKFMCSGPLVAICLEGENAIAEVRKMMGALEPQEAIPGTIRGDFTLVRQENIIHGSDSQKSVQRELPILFSKKELLK